jgi:hypothetical protein
MILFKNQHIMQKLNCTATQSKTEHISQEKRKLNNSKVHSFKDYEHKGHRTERTHFQETILPSVCESFILLQSLLGIYQQREKCEMMNNCSRK